ncbi:hypothetical protein GLOIN_2v1069653 [Rhizophagus irregularis DAOM 181602=DAOM 197198]|uniref:Uncharacterized protein n=1 Tax=Rhizophagus irregularis (strain DAOM 181602 / DAOM 197198 / MUCL 43194) TaxID=747089 RepID=A0A2P4Q8G3_RHIID|nr:hypothetical protein GLOIN_2v1069653 [Rhizophagus irregularis DAOM 181602=DAOM 197198]POG73916.1 hypothetical protein GLOIN_2v1069653 [Rhizophagus irregularis DAOM 181602=DAOM 197198]GET62544.1 hypothetical protein GLOIN_2v1069653 [Rhizophagus irregularis DAOM 181602=DAOM 197198]|eukprot:XP_025180782.1 hypothetical protein GLOIN_2v1069653 [Rhizophagus irregularis DAOM 181602=DAOM 197198]
MISFLSPFLTLVYNHISPIISLLPSPFSMPIQSHFAFFFYLFYITSNLLHESRCILIFKILCLSYLPSTTLSCLFVFK